MKKKKVNYIFPIIILILSAIVIFLLIYLYNSDIIAFNPSSTAKNQQKDPIQSSINDFSSLSKECLIGLEYGSKCQNYDTNKLINEFNDLKNYILSKNDLHLCYDLKNNINIAYCLGKIDINKCFNDFKDDSSTLFVCKILDCNNNPSKYSKSNSNDCIFLME